jgi:hypothetical protein
LCSRTQRDKPYRTFLNLTRYLGREGASPEAIYLYLSELSGESTVWPDDAAFQQAWITAHAYQTLAFPKRIVHVLLRINETYLGKKSEDITINSPLTVEHIMPRNWLENWLLPDNSKGLDSIELWDATEGDERAELTRRRNMLLQTFGNLTVLVQPLNSAISNSPWAVKRPEILQHAILPINQQLHAFETWDETAIERRGKALFDKAVSVWPAPGRNS